MIPRTWWMFIGFWLGGAVLASWDKDVCFGLMFAMVGMMAFGNRGR